MASIHTPASSPTRLLPKVDDFYRYEPERGLQRITQSMLEGMEGAYVKQMIDLAGKKVTIIAAQEISPRDLEAIRKKFNQHDLVGTALEVIEHENRTIKFEGLSPQAKQICKEYIDAREKLLGTPFNSAVDAAARRAWVNKLPAGSVERTRLESLLAGINEHYNRLLSKTPLPIHVPRKAIAEAEFKEATSLAAIPETFRKALDKLGIDREWLRAIEENFTPEENVILQKHLLNLAGISLLPKDEYLKSEAAFQQEALVEVQKAEYCLQYGKDGHERRLNGPRSKNMAMILPVYNYEARFRLGYE